MNSEKIVIGILFGLAAGVILGVLVAPEKGSETRKKIVQSRDSLVEELEKKLNNLINQLSGSEIDKSKLTENNNGKANQQQQDLAGMYPNVVS
ncbi:MAG: YtxH domain-containing protein [Saprospiraceae bacterium]|nr:YtxH domain-containing protein [Saprospiraceae bacterium]MBK8298424.1 YtxH domain-containing protein [Saprospiraceae bacterium]